LSLIDPSGWSIILPDLGEPDGAYEGFSFLGFSTIFLLIILLVAKLNTNMNVVKNVDFAAIWVTSIIGRWLWETP
jgi:predicted permease